MTHKQLVNRMVHWLRHTRRYSVVVAERATRVSETPDVLGFHGGKSLLIECKVSRADFLADREKQFRAQAEQGMGDLRYYAAPGGILTPADLPLGWGLLEVRSNNGVRFVVEATSQPANKRNEVSFLVSAIRRLEIACTVFVQHEAAADYSDNPTPDLTPAESATIVD